jgi:hypothetical protein
MSRRRWRRSRGEGKAQRLVEESVERFVSGKRCGGMARSNCHWWGGVGWRVQMLHQLQYVTFNNVFANIDFSKLFKNSNKDVSEIEDRS